MKVRMVFPIGPESVMIARGQLGNLKEKFFEDAEQRRGNITKTAVDIPELHGMQVRRAANDYNHTSTATTTENYLNI